VAPPPTPKPDLSLFPTTGSEFTEFVCSPMWHPQLITVVDRNLGHRSTRFPRYYYCSQNRHCGKGKSRGPLGSTILSGALTLVFTIPLWHPFESNSSACHCLRRARCPLSVSSLFVLYVNVGCAISPNQAELEPYVPGSSVIHRASHVLSFLLACEGYDHHHGV
jgi:hypothetical protein